MLLARFTERVRRMLKPIQEEGDRKSKMCIHNIKTKKDTISSQLPVFSAFTYCIQCFFATLESKIIGELVLTGLALAVLIAGANELIPPGIDAEASTLQQMQQEEAVWETLPEMPTPRIWLGTAVLAETIFAIGGASAPNQQGIKTVEAFDTRTGEWKAMADMKIDRQGLTTAEFHGKIYAMGGMLPEAQGFRSSIEEYDPTTNEWTLTKDLPYQVAYSNAVVLEGEMYLIGGYGAGTLKRVISTVDPVAGDWEEKENLLFARESAGVCVYKGKIYYMGGWDSALTPQSRAMKYDPGKDEWKEVAEMPRSRAGFPLVVAGDKILAIGGHSAQGNTTVSVIDIYDPEADEWIGEIPMPMGRSWFSACIVNGGIYLIGGSTFFDAQGWPPNDFLGILEKLTLPGWFSVSFRNKLRATWGKIKNSSRENPGGIP